MQSTQRLDQPSAAGWLPGEFREYHPPRRKDQAQQLADIVAKVTEQMLWKSYLKQSNRDECAARGQGICRLSIFAAGSRTNRAGARWSR
jgi:hypothetical protein